MGMPQSVLQITYIPKKQKTKEKQSNVRFSKKNRLKVELAASLAAEWNITSSLTPWLHPFQILKIILSQFL